MPTRYSTRVATPTPGAVVPVTPCEKGLDRHTIAGARGMHRISYRYYSLLK